MRLCSVRHAVTRLRASPEDRGVETEVVDVDTTKSDAECVGTGTEVVCESGVDIPASSSTQTEEEGDLVAKVLGTMVLVSPFFLWGTAMVAMKVSGLQTSD